jgi:methylase of polypeptide subunit release factors
MSDYVKQLIDLACAGQEELTKASPSAGPLQWVRRIGRSIRVRVLLAAMRTGSRLPRARLAGLTLRVAPGMCNPSPLPGVSIEKLFAAGIYDLSADDTVLDMGTGTGIWALMASRYRARVTASDLAHISEGVVADNALFNGLEPPEVVTGDLFENLVGRRFDRILFNPPFHLGTPQSLGDTAYLGGADGQVLKRFFVEFSDHLKPGGSVCIILPAIEWRQYAPYLAPFDVIKRQEQWLPLLGVMYCLELRRSS